MKEKSFANNRFPLLLLSAALSVFLVIVIGGVLRVTEVEPACRAILACADRWLLSRSAEAFLPFSHHLLGLLSLLLVAAAAGISWRRYRPIRLLAYPLVLAFFLMLGQGLLGGLLAFAAGSPLLASLHLGIALTILGLLIASTVMAFVLHHNPAQKDRLKFQSPFAHQGLYVLFGLFVVLVSGAFVAASEATYACSGWPLCNGEWIPTHPLGWVNVAHRLLVGLVGIYMLVLLRNAWRSQRSQRAILSAASLLVVLYFAQLLVGALNVSKDFPATLLGLHMASAAALWAMAVVLGTLTGLAARSPEEESAEAAIPIDSQQRLHDLLSLTKPLIVALLLVTTYAGMVVGARTIPALALTFWTLLGGALAAGGSGAVNQYIDRQPDQRMARTARRPIASGRMTPAEGLAFGLSLLVVSFYIFASFVNLLAALLALAGMIYYIIIYSIWLKHATTQNIVIGGGAGAIPPMVGWAAATGRLDIPALFLFAIIFMWTPPHFWALALIRQKEYARAGIPMLPVVRGEQATRWQILIYTLELVALTLLLPLFGMAGALFLFSAAILGAWLILAAWKLWSVGGNKIAWRMYRYSSMYLALLFAALVVDALI